MQVNISISPLQEVKFGVKRVMELLYHLFYPKWPGVGL